MLSGFCRVPSLLCSGNLVSAKQANMPELINAKIVLTISTQLLGVNTPKPISSMMLKNRIKAPVQRMVRRLLFCTYAATKKKPI